MRKRMRNGELEEIERRKERGMENQKGKKEEEEDTIEDDVVVVK